MMPADKVYETESQLVADALLEFGALDWLWIWRENTGVAYGSGLVKAATKQIMMGKAKEALGILRGLQPITFGIPGRADISGILLGGRMTAWEAKIKHRPRSTDQKKWAEMFVKMGGLYIHFEQVSDIHKALRAEGYTVKQ